MKDFAGRRSGRERLILGVVLAVLAVAAVVILILMAVASVQAARTAESAAEPSDEVLVTASADALPPSSASASPGGTATTGDQVQEEIRLVDGSDRVSGVTIGWPHSLSGAISAAVEDWTQVSSTLSPDRAAAIGRIIADPSWTSAADEFAAGVVSTRRHLGLAESGDVNGVISLSVSAYQLRNTTADDATVLLLGYLTTSGSKNAETSLGVFPVQMHWAESEKDWRVMESTSDVDYSDLAQEPGTDAAAEAGWLEIEQ